MNHALKIGQTVKCETSGGECRVVQWIGEGNQGEVYRAELDGKPAALKWYFAPSATPEQRSAIEALVRRGAPSPRFLWPIELVTLEGAPGFGYVMPLRDAGFHSINALMRRVAEPSFRSLATAAFGLAEAFLALHSRGYCYRDISNSNVFLHPDTGEVLVCDNDNVAVDGTASAVLGTLGFMAPEITRGQAQPGIQTDLFSLAVLLFHMFFIEHPLHGRREAAIRCLDFVAKQKLYGTQPLFMFDPADRSNGPVAGVHNNAIEYWRLYPAFLRDLFPRAFRDGVRDPLARVRESEWKRAMVRLRDSIVYCRCGAENFYDASAVSAGAAGSPTCWRCRGGLALPMRMRLGGKDVVMLNHDTRLFAHHIGGADWDFDRAFADVMRHPTDPGLWGLRNLSSAKWTAIGGDGSVREVEPGRSVHLAPGTRIQFGPTEGELRY